MKLNVSRLKTVIKWVLITDLLAVIVGVVTMLTGTREPLIAAISAAGIPQPSPVETIGLFVLTVVSFYVVAELADRTQPDSELAPNSN